MTTYNVTFIVISPFMTYHIIFDKSYMKGATSRTGTVYLSREPSSHGCFVWLGCCSISSFLCSVLFINVFFLFLILLDETVEYSAFLFYNLCSRDKNLVFSKCVGSGQKHYSPLPFPRLLRASMYNG
jgi:hypothetical protein